jgi:hypothetical protein
VAGILDSKSRVIDLVLTPYGRRQLASGALRITSATVADRASYYVREETGGAEDATERIYFESFSTPGDQVTLESNDQGQLLPFVADNFTVSGESAYDEAGVSLQDPARFASLGEELSSASGENFSRLKILLTDDPEDPQTTNFELRGTTHSFVPAVPDLMRPPRVHVDSLESLLFDKRLARKPNFRYLPPVNDVGSQLGNYKDVRQQFDASLEETNISSLLAGSSGTQYQIFRTTMEQTSESNNIALQVFETTSRNGIRKLDLIDFGTVTLQGRQVRVVFAGRVFINSYEFPTFVNVLTLVLT